MEQGMPDHHRLPGPESLDDRLRREAACFRAPIPDGLPGRIQAGLQPASRGRKPISWRDGVSGPARWGPLAAMLALAVGALAISLALLHGSWGQPPMVALHPSAPRAPVARALSPPSLAAVTQAVSQDPLIAALNPWRMADQVDPLTQEWQRINSDVRHATGFLVASLPAIPPGEELH